LEKRLKYLSLLAVAFLRRCDWSLFHSWWLGRFLQRKRGLDFARLPHLKMFFQRIRLLLLLSLLIVLVFRISQREIPLDLHLLSYALLILLGIIGRYGGLVCFRARVSAAKSRVVNYNIRIKPSLLEASRYSSSKLFVIETPRHLLRLRIRYVRARSRRCVAISVKIATAWLSVSIKLGDRFGGAGGNHSGDLAPSAGLAETGPGFFLRLSQLVWGLGTAASLRRFDHEAIDFVLTPRDRLASR
jgi:hypothetical protein